MKSLNEKLADPLSTIMSQNADLMEANLTIAQLTAENERLQRVVEQAIELGMIHADHFGIYSMAKVREVDTYPDLFAQLKGVERG